MNNIEINIKSLTLIFLFTQWFLLVGCETNSTSPNGIVHEESEPFYFDSLSVEEIKELIVGEWEWTHSIIMSRGVHPPDNLITPAAAGYTMQYVFESSGKVSFLKNKQAAEVHAYEIKKFKILPEDAGFVKQIIISGHARELRFFHPDSMMIGTGWLDGIDKYFVRKK